MLGPVGGLLGAGAAVYTVIRVPAIERLRAQLQREGAEHEVRFGRLHERRVLVLDEMYKLLVRAERAMGTWTHPLREAGAPPEEELVRRAVDAINEFRTYFVEHRIWLDADLEPLVGAFDKKLVETLIKHTTYSPDDPSVHRERLEAWKDVWETMQNEVPNVRRGIEHRFRLLLGVTPPEL